MPPRRSLIPSVLAAGDTPSQSILWSGVASLLSEAMLRPEVGLAGAVAVLNPAIAAPVIAVATVCGVCRYLRGKRNAETDAALKVQTWNLARKAEESAAEGRDILRDIADGTITLETAVNDRVRQDIADAVAGSVRAELDDEFRSVLELHDKLDIALVLGWTQDARGRRTEDKLDSLHDKFDRFFESQKQPGVDPTTMAVPPDVLAAAHELIKSKDAQDRARAAIVLRQWDEWQREVDPRKASPTISERETNNLHAALVRRNPRFVGRGELLRDLHARLTGGTNTSLSHALSADGGVGKTEIAAAYVTSDEYAPSWEGIWWLDASKEGFDSSLLVLLRVLGLDTGDGEDAIKITREQAQHEIVRRLGDGRHLVVLDNVDSTDTITGFPFRSTTTLLVTTRLAAMPGDIAETIPVDNLGPEDAARLLVSGRPDLRDGETGLPLAEHRETIREIAAELGHLALALAITARAFERRAGQTPERMLGRIREAVRTGWVRPFAEIGEGVESRNYRRGVAASLLMHLPELEESVPLASALLLLASLCHAERIPVSLLASCVSVDADAVEQALLALQERSMIVFEENAGVDGSGLVSLHRLTQSACRARSDSETNAAAHASLVHALNAVFDDASRPDRWASQREAESHTLSVIGDDAHRTDSEPMAMLLNQIAFMQQALGRAAEAEPIYRQALDMNRRLFDGDHPAVAQSLNNLAGVRITLGRADQAEPIFRQALDMRRRLYEGDHPDVAMSLNNLAGVKESLGRAAEAEPIYRQALDMTRRLYEGDHPAVAMSLNNLASVKESLGRAAEAEPIYRQALDMTRRLYEGDHPDVAMSLNNLAYVKESLGRAAEAEPIYRQALDMNRRLFGGDHPAVAMSLNNLASVKESLGRAAEAEPIYRQALDMTRRLYEGDHPDVAMSLNNLASVKRALGRAAEAEPIFREALDMTRRLFGGDHPDVATGLNNLAVVRVTLGLMREALGPATEAAEMAGRCMPEGHPDRVIYEKNLAILLERLKGDE